MTSSERHLVFISHANPEDNEFARWLGMHLVRRGYQVWSDITKLIGGETWWNDIEDAIRNDTAKFIFVLSGASNTKQGTRNELHLALNLERQVGIRDFVIPLLVDSELAFGDINIQLSNRNAIRCTDGWAQGLSQLLAKLEEDGVPRNQETCDPTTVSNWWREHIAGAGVLRDSPTPMASNWFPLTGLPEQMRVIHLEGKKWKDDPDRLPAHRIAGYVVSFASSEELGLGGCKEDIVNTRDAIAEEAKGTPIYPQNLRFAVVRLLRLAWAYTVKDLGMPTSSLANGNSVGYFTDELLGGEKRTGFSVPGLCSGQRALTGQYRGHRWHYGLSGDVTLEPEPSFILRGHVLFSDDGTSLWDSKARLHRARRSACSNWWNDRWRDMMLAAVAWMSRRQADNQGEIRLILSETLDAVLDSAPRVFQSPVTFGDADIAEDVVEDADWDAAEEFGDNEGDDDAD